jgi:hypothetical protein
MFRVPTIALVAATIAAACGSGVTLTPVPSGRRAAGGILHQTGARVVILRME